jgi:hypothetical protein
MALPLDYFAIDLQSNRDIPRCRRLLPYYWQRSRCQAVKTAVHEVARAGVGGVMWQLLTPRDNVVQSYGGAANRIRTCDLCLRRLATNIDVHFCDPQSPWQRGSDENTNGLLRQYFPRGTDLSVYSQTHLNKVARQLNVGRDP